MESTVPSSVPSDVPSADELDRAWQPPGGIIGWFSQVNHRSIGARYIATGLTFFILAGIAALLMRIQLMFPENTFINPELFNQLFTMHGTTMMFLFGVPIMEGIGLYLVPLMIGARDAVFPRLNAFGYYVYLISGIVLWFSFFIGSAPDGGWFNYVPLTAEDFSPGIGIDVYTTMITFLEVAALVAAVELILTIFLMRAPGMSLNRIPLFVWAILVMAFMIVFAMPPLMVATVELALDRTIGAHFFNVALGGDPLLWQHLFWFFGHPEVYIIFVPALGIVAAVLPTFCKRPVIGYTWVALSFVAIGFLSFGLWVHHMFATGLPLLGLSFFAVASMVIAIPSGVVIFAALATMWYGSISFRTPMLFIFGFIVTFVLGGITGVMVASVPFDWQVHDTYFVVAHFHYVLIGGAVFPLFAGFYYWFPKLTGRMLNERMGTWQFWLMFIGFNVAFLPMHLTGFLGMPRRVYTYLPQMGWDELNMISSIGAFVLAGGAALFLVNVSTSLRRGEVAGDNPWNAGTLEWGTSSPPAPYNFRYIPAVTSREPLWDMPDELEYQDIPHVEKRLLMEDTRRESLGTSILDAIPQQRFVLPGPTHIPILAALTVSFIFVSMMIDLILIPLGALVFYILLALWHWPDRQMRDMDYVKAGPEGALPTNTVASGISNVQPNFWWGVLFLIIIETVVFASLITTYFYLRSGAPVWPLGDIDPPELLLPTINAFILFSSSIPLHLADKGIQEGKQRQLKIGLVVACLMATVFLVLKYIEYSDLDYNWATNAYGSIVWTITGFHSVHVLALLLKTVIIGIWAFQGYFNEERNAAVQSNGLYWHFVVLIWVPLFFTLYISPYLF